MMKHIKLYEEFMTQNLDPKTKTEYFEELEKHVWRPDLFKSDPDLWSAVVAGPEVIDDDDDEVEEPEFDISSEKYQELLDAYEGIPQEQHQLNHFMRMASGFGDDPDEDDYFIMEPEEYMEAFKGLDPKLILMAMSLGKQQLYFDVEWEQVK